jgi:hypothetical protein
MDVITLNFENWAFTFREVSILLRGHLPILGYFIMFFIVCVDNHLTHLKRDDKCFGLTAAKLLTTKDEKKI